MGSNYANSEQLLPFLQNVYAPKNVETKPPEKVTPKTVRIKKIIRRVTKSPIQKQKEEIEKNERQRTLEMEERQIEFKNLISNAINKGSIGRKKREISEIENSEFDFGKDSDFDIGKEPEIDIGNDSEFNVGSNSISKSDTEENIESNNYQNIENLDEELKPLSDEIQSKEKDVSSENVNQSNFGFGNQNPSNSDSDNQPFFNLEPDNPENANLEQAYPENANPEQVNPENVNQEQANPELANPELTNQENANQELINPEDASTPSPAGRLLAEYEVGVWVPVI